MTSLLLQAGAGEARLDILQLILNASPVVKGVLGLLILMSLASSQPQAVAHMVGIRGGRAKPQSQSARQQVSAATSTPVQGQTWSASSPSLSPAA